MAVPTAGSSTAGERHAPAAPTCNFDPWVFHSSIDVQSASQVQSGFFISSRSSDIVVSRETAIELLSVSSSGQLSSISVQHVYATILHLKTLPCKGEAPDGRDLLLLFTDTGNLSVLLFSQALNRFVALQHCPLAVPGGLNLNSLGHALAVAPGGQAVAAAACQESIAVLPVTLPVSAHERAALLHDAASRLEPPHLAVLSPHHAMYHASGAGAAVGLGPGASATAGTAPASPASGTCTVWSMAFVPQVLGQCDGSSADGSADGRSGMMSGSSGCVLHVAALLHRQGRGDSEVMVLRYCPLSSPTTLLPLASILMSHSSVLGIPTALTPVPCQPSGLVVVGTTSLLLLDVAVLLERALSRMRVWAQHSSAQPVAAMHPLVTCSLAHLGPEPKEAALEVARLLATGVPGHTPRPSQALAMPSWLHPLVGPGSGAAGVSGGAGAGPTCDAATAPVVLYQPLRGGDGERCGLSRTSVDRSGGSSVKGGTEAGSVLGAVGINVALPSLDAAHEGGGSRSTEEPWATQQHVVITTAWLPQRAGSAGSGPAGTEAGPDVLVVATSAGKMVACTISASLQPHREAWGALASTSTGGTSASANMAAAPGTASPPHLHMRCVPLKLPAGGIRPASDLLGLPDGVGMLYCEEQGDVYVLGVPETLHRLHGGLAGACAAACKSRGTVSELVPGPPCVPVSHRSPFAPATPGLLGLLHATPGPSNPSGLGASASGPCTAAPTVPLAVLSRRLQTGPTVDCALGPLTGEGRRPLYALTCHAQTDGVLPMPGALRPGGGAGVGQRVARGGISVLHTGVDAQPLAHWPAGSLPAATGLWPVPLTPAHTHHALLVASFLCGSRALTLGTDMTDVTEPLGLSACEPTVAAGVVQEGIMAHVTPTAVLLCCMDAVVGTETVAPGPRAEVLAGSGLERGSVGGAGLLGANGWAQAGSTHAAPADISTVVAAGAVPRAAGSRGSGAGGGGSAAGPLRGGPFAWRSPKNSRHEDGALAGPRGCEWGLPLAPRAQSWSGVITEEEDGGSQQEVEGSVAGTPTLGGTGREGEGGQVRGGPGRFLVRPYPHQQHTQSTAGIGSSAMLTVSAPPPQIAALQREVGHIASSSPPPPPGLPRSGGSRGVGSRRRLSAQPTQAGPHLINSPAPTHSHTRTRRLSARASPAGTAPQDVGASPVRAALRELRMGSSSSASEMAVGGMDVDGGGVTSGERGHSPAWAWVRPDVSAVTPTAVGAAAGGLPLSAADFAMQLCADDGALASSTLNHTTPRASQAMMTAAHYTPDTMPHAPPSSSSGIDAASLRLGELEEPGVWRAASAPLPPSPTQHAPEFHDTAVAAAPHAGHTRHILTAAIAPGCVVAALSRESALQVLSVVSKADGGAMGPASALRGRKRARVLWHVQHAGTVAVADEVSCLQLQMAPLAMLPQGAPAGSQPYWLLVGDRSPATTLHLLVLNPQGLLLQHTPLARAVLPARIQAAWDTSDMGGGPTLPAVPQSMLIRPSPPAPSTACCPVFVASSTALGAAAARTPVGPASAAASFTTASSSPACTVQWLVGYRQGSAALYQADVRGSHAAFLLRSSLGVASTPPREAAGITPARLLWHSKLGQQPVDLSLVTANRGTGVQAATGAGAMGAPGAALLSTGSGGSGAIGLSSSAGGGASGLSAGGGGGGGGAQLWWPPVLAVGSTTAILQVSQFNGHVAWRTIGLKDVAHACSLLLPPTATDGLRRSSSCGGGLSTAGGAAADIHLHTHTNRAGTTGDGLRAGEDGRNSTGYTSSSSIAMMPIILTVQQDTSWTISEMSLGAELRLPTASTSSLFPSPALGPLRGGVHSSSGDVGPQAADSAACGALKHVQLHPSGYLVMLASPAQPQSSTHDTRSSHRVLAVSLGTGACVATLSLPAPESGTCLALWSAMVWRDELTPRARTAAGVSRECSSCMEDEQLPGSMAALHTSGNSSGQRGAIPPPPLQDDSDMGEGQRVDGGQAVPQPSLRPEDGMVWEGQGQVQGEVEGQAGTSAGAHLGEAGLGPRAVCATAMDAAGAASLEAQEQGYPAAATVPVGLGGSGGSGAGLGTSQEEADGRWDAGPHTSCSSGSSRRGLSGSSLHNATLVLLGTSLAGSSDAQPRTHPAQPPEARGQLHVLQLVGPLRAGAGSGYAASAGGASARWDVISSVKLPAAVGAVCGIRPRVAVASVGKRLVVFHLKSGRLTKFGWLGTRNMVTHLATCGVSGTLAAADGTCTITLYMYRDDAGEGLRPLQVIAADAACRPVTSLTLLPPTLTLSAAGTSASATVVVCDAGGAVSMLQVEPQPRPPMCNLDTVASFNLVDIGTRVHVTQVELDQLVGVPAWAQRTVAMPTNPSTTMLLSEGTPHALPPTPSSLSFPAATHMASASATAAVLPGASYSKPPAIGGGIPVPSAPGLGTSCAGLHAAAHALPRTKLLISGLSGAVYSMVATPGGAVAVLLRELESLLASLPATAPLSGVRHGRHRGTGHLQHLQLHTPHEARGVLDGDLLVEFLQLPRALQERVVSSLWEGGQGGVAAAVLGLQDTLSQGVVDVAQLVEWAVGAC